MARTLVDAIKAAVKMESVKVDPTLSAEEKQRQVNEQLAIVSDSNLLALGAIGDEGIELREQAEEILNEAGINPREYRRENALAGAKAAAAGAAEQHAAEVVEADAAQDAIEQADAEQLLADDAEEQPEG